MGAAIFIPVFYFHHLLAILKLQKNKKNFLSVIYLFALISLILSFSPYFVLTVKPRLAFRFWPIAGPVFLPFLICWLGIVIYGAQIIYVHYKKSSGHLRNQLRYILVATLIGWTGGVTNYFLWFDIPILPYGNILVSVYIVMVSYAIIRHQLLDIEVVLKKTLVFAGISFFIFALFTSVSLLVTEIFQRQVSGAARLWLFALVGMAVTAIIRPLDSFLVRLTDRYLFQKRYDYKVLLREASQEMATIKSLQKLAKVVVAFLVRKARISRVVLFVHSDKVNGYEMTACRPYYGGDVRFLRETHPIVERLIHVKKPISREEVKNGLQTGKNSSEGETFGQVMALLDEFKADVVIPSFLYLEDGRRNSDGHQALLRCLLFLGPKKSDEEYSQEDLDVFFTIAQESAIAVENARLYDEAVNRSYELEEMNEELQGMNKRLQVTQASLIVAEKSATMVGMAKAIGHEVNNPLSAVIYRSQAIEKDGVGKLQEWMKKHDGALSGADREALGKILANVKDHAGRIRRSGDRIAVVVKTLTNIMKEAKGEMGPLSLTVLCREAIEATRFSTYEENLSSCEIKESISANVIIYGNLEQLIQVFVNLIKNAYEAMLNQKERRIEIRGGVDPQSRGMARVEVADNGPGIPPEVLPRIWQQGFSTKKRVDDSIGAAGQGQGLFICKHMIESVHKGVLTVESVTGKGTTFIIKLPLAEIGQDA